LSKLTAPIPVFLRRPYLEALRRRADERGLREAEAAARLLEDALEPYLHDAEVADQVNAERELILIAEDLAREEASRPDWNEHLALAVFERIRAEHLDLYRAATSGDHRDGVNRRIGRHIKTAVGAEVRTIDKKAVTAKVPRSLPALISRYSLLEEPSSN
jgi:hypothetical protein